MFINFQIQNGRSIAVQKLVVGKYFSGECFLIDKLSKIDNNKRKSGTKEFYFKCLPFQQHKIKEQKVIS